MGSRLRPIQHFAIFTAYTSPPFAPAALIETASYAQAQQSTPAQTKSASQRFPTGLGLAVAEIEALIEHYLYDCELRLQSPRTLETRRVFFRNWLWFLRHRRYQMCGVEEVRQFLHYLGHGHEEDGGRFGKANLKRAARPVTVFDYYVCLRSFYD